MKRKTDRSVPAGFIGRFARLEWDLINSNRFFLSDENSEFVRYMVEYFKAKPAVLRSGSNLFRARAIKDRPNMTTLRMFGRFGQPHKLEEMKAPPSSKASEGRINPQGVSYLYCAKNEATAIAEVRPWADCQVTVAKLKVSKKCRLADITYMDTKPSLRSSKPSEDERNERDWIFFIRNVVARCFSTPNNPHDLASYVVSQYISGAIKDAGLDGVMYSSSLYPRGVNVALFDQNVVDVESVSSHLVHRIRVASVRMRN